MTGECLKCFRAVPRSSFSSVDSAIAPIPTLRSVEFSSHPLAPIVSIFESQNSSSNSRNQSLLHPTVRSIIGRISQSSESFLVTGGTDRQIRSDCLIHLYNIVAGTPCHARRWFQTVGLSVAREVLHGVGHRTDATKTSL